MSRPAFQFYPGDWLREIPLRGCSLAARGLWLELMNLAHFGTPYGYVTLGDGRPMPKATLARMVCCSEAELEALLAELGSAGIYSVAESGAIFSRRMVRDEALRQRRAEGGEDGREHGVKGAQHGAKGGRPKKTPLHGGILETPLETPLPGGYGKPPPAARQTADAEADADGSPLGGSDSPRPVSTPDPTGQADSPPARGKKRKRAPAKSREAPPNPDHKPLIEYFVAQFEGRYGTKYVFDGGRDAARVAKILGLTDLATAKRAIKAAMADTFWSKNVITLDDIARHLSRFVGLASEGLFTNGRRMSETERATAQVLAAAAARAEGGPNGHA